MFIKKLFVYLVTCCLALGISIESQATEEVPNGSFEEIDEVWECDDNCINPVTFYIVPGTAAKGSYYAYIFHEAGLYQDLTIPNDVSSLSFQYDNQDDGDETGSFTVSLTDTTTNEVYVSETFAEQSDSWITGSLDIPSSAVGQTVRLLLSNVTGFNRIDALEFTTVTTSKKGRAPKFTILRDLSDGKSVQLCVKKKSIRECTAITPTSGAETAYEFSFSNTQVK